MGINNWKADKSEETSTESQNSKKSTGFNNENGKIGWILLWAIGIPIPILLVLFVLRGCT